MGSVVALVCAAVGMLSTASALTYSGWIAGYPSLTGSATLESADPDADGVTNLMEFAMEGMDPTVTTTIGTPVMHMQTRNADGSYNTPTTATRVTNEFASFASAHLVLKFKKRTGIEGIRYVPQINSINLKDWGWGESAITEWVDGDGFTWARSNSDFRLWHRQFIRLKVEAIP